MFMFTCLHLVLLIIVHTPENKTTTTYVRVHAHVLLTDIPSSNKDTPPAPPPVIMAMDTIPCRPVSDRHLVCDF